MEAMNSVPPGLQALLSASESLGISMTAPGPQGEQPTVASQILQQANSPQMASIKQQAGIAALVAKQDQVFAEHAQLARHVAGVGGQADRMPVAAQQLAHGRARAHLCEVLAAAGRRAAVGRAGVRSDRHHA